MLKYTLYRLALFAAFTLILLLLGVPEWWAIIFGAMFSMVTSFFVLARPREEAARTIEAKVERSRARRAEKLADERTDETDEDAEDAETGDR